MRRTVAALAIAGALALSLAIACGGDVAHPDIPAPPAETENPISYLVESAGDLKLTPAQITSLKDIQTNLGGQLDIIDMRLKALGTRHEANAGSARQQQPGGLRMGGGRGRRGQMQRSQVGSGAGSGSARRAPGAIKLEDERENDIRDAIHRALALLEPAQRKAAIDIFMDRGLDLLLPDEGSGSADEQGSN
jgi:hypothetical protein